MWVSRLRLEHFRNHTLTDCSLEPGVTIFIGSNGQGKTNLVEALVYLATGDSHRTTSDDALVQNGFTQAQINATVHADNRSVRLGLTLNAKGTNKPVVNDQVTTMTDLSSWLNAVTFSPEDLAIIRHDPSHRRRFLDMALVSHLPRLSSVFSDFDRVVKQRNMALKSFRHGRRDTDSDRTLEVWDDKIIDLSTDITRARWDFIASLTPHVRSAYDHIRPGHRVDVKLLFSHTTLEELTPHASPDVVRSTYREALRQLAAEEKDRGVTLFGPHRDDVGIFLNDLPSRTHSSQGEAWSIALALKIAVASLSREHSFSGDPVIILDDVFSELDQQRRQALAEAVGHWEQVIITSAVASDIPESLVGQTRRIEEGAIVDE